eukprot:SAG31_NODE_956_length_10790_cov_34.583107_4_plen_74_part_00
MVAEIAWLLGAYQLELDVQWLDTKSNVTADAASRWYAGKITGPQYMDIVRKFREGKPVSLAAAGLRYAPPPRP